MSVSIVTKEGVSVLDMVSVESVTVSVRGEGGAVHEDLEWSAATGGELRTASPWRTFRWYKGQRHYSGSYWAATAGDHVIYESRLELTRLLYADFDTDVDAIVAQPFLLKAQVGGQTRRHVPDYLLCGRGVPVVVDVKPRHRLADPKVAEALGWARRAVEARGWAYEVWCEPPPDELANVRFLAGYRRGWLFDEELVDVITRSDLDGVLIRDALARFGGWPRDLVKAALLHVLWRQIFTVDLDVPLHSGLELRWRG